MNEASTSKSEHGQDGSKQKLLRHFMAMKDKFALFGLPLPGEIPEGFLPDKLPMTPKSTPLAILKNAILIALSANKQWIAYVTDQPASNIKTLNVIRLVGPNGSTHGDAIPAIVAKTDLTGIYSMQDKIINGTNGGYFISVSSKGDRIVLSSMYANMKKSCQSGEGSPLITGENRDIERAQTGQDSCLVFKVSKNVHVDIDKKIIQERPFSNFQGRAVFLEDDSLALINSNVMTVYNPSEGYKKKYWIDLRTLKSNLHINHFYVKIPVLKPGWAYPIYETMKYHDEYLKLIYLTQYITQGFLTTYYMGVAQVWSVHGAGIQLISLADEGQEIIGISCDEKFVAKMPEDSAFLGIYHTKTGLLVNRLKQRRIAGVEFLQRQAHHAYFCSKHHFLLWISFREVRGSNQMYISFELWNAPSEILISYQEIVVPMLFIQNWQVEPWIIEQESQSFIPKLLIYYATYEGNRAIALRSIILDVYTPPQVRTSRRQQQENSRATGAVKYKMDSTSLQTNGDVSISKGSGKAQNERNNYTSENQHCDNSSQNQDGDLQDISWSLKSVPSSRTQSYKRYEHYQVENSLDNVEELTCYEMNYRGAKYLLRFGTHTVQLWRLGTQDEAEQLLYIRAYKPASEPFTQDYDYKWIHSTQQEYSGSEEDSRAFAKNLQPNENGRIEISVCSEESVNGLDHVKESRLDEVYLPLRELMHSEISLQEKKAKQQRNRERMSEKARGKLRANANTSVRNSGSNRKSFGQRRCYYQFRSVQYHYIESVCQALHYLCIYPKTKELKGNEVCIKSIITVNEKYSQISIVNYQERVEDLVRKTIKIVENTIREMKKVKSNYFTTILGSNTLALLSSFNIGREILLDILETDSLPISLFSYVRKNAKTERLDERITRKENALTILIEMLEYDLYHLLFNRLVLHSTKLGIGSFSALTDTLVFLQNRGAQEVLAISLQQLSFLEMDRYALPTLSTVAEEKMYMYALHKNSGTDFRDLASHSGLEQVIKYDNNRFLEGFINHIFYWCSTYIRYDIFLTEDQHESWSKKFKEIRIFIYATFFNMDKNEVNRSLFRTCAVPFLYYNTYDLPPEDKDDGVTTIDKQGFKVKSTFLELALEQHENDLYHQQNTVLVVLLQYKWKTFVRRRFFLVCFIHIVYYVTYSVGVLFATEAFDYTTGTSIYGKHLACIILMFFLGTILLIQEIRQFYKSNSWFSYLFSLYNHFDLAVIVLPIVTFWQMRCDTPGLYELGSISTICFWIHAILRLRAIDTIGITLETIIKLMKSVYKLLLIMLLVIFGFTNAFMVLLSRKDDSYFQEKFSGMTNLSQSVDFSDVSSSNSFSNPLKAFSILWFCIFGVWDPFMDGDAGDDYMIIILAMLFSLVTILLFFNLVIALMSSKAEELKALGTNIWLGHFAAVIAEIEQLWCTPFERHWRRNNPHFIYYVAKQVDIENQRKNIKSLSHNIVQEQKSKGVRDRGALWKYNEYPSIYDRLNNNARHDKHDQIAADRLYDQEKDFVLLELDDL